MSGQFARLNESLHRAHPTTLNQRIEVFASDLHAILDHYLITQNQAANDLLLLRQALDTLAYWLEHGETPGAHDMIQRTHDALRARLHGDNLSPTANLTKTS